MSTDGKDSSSSGDDVQFIEWHVPGFPTGTYRLEVTQEVKIGQDPPRPFTRTSSFVVEGQRSALRPADIVALYPPDGGVGDYVAVLPHVVLSRSTLPWERVVVPARDNKQFPWLAILLFEDREKPTPIPVDPSDLGQQRDDGQATASAIKVPWSLLRSLLPPSIDDLRYLAHVREAGDDVAVVLGNRLPVVGGTSTVHLVSVEKLYDGSGNLIAPAGTGDPLVPLLSLKSWSFTCSREPGGFEAVVRALDRGFDLRLMPWGDGSGVPASEKSLVVVGIGDDKLLHIRIFDAGGKRVGEVDETKLPATQAGAISALKQRIPGLLPSHVLTRAETDRVLHDVTSIIDQTLSRKPPTLQLPAVGQPDADPRLAAGLVPLPHGLRRSGRTVSWYRGPLAPADSTDSFEGVRAADALLRHDPATGLLDVSYAAAWELGRLLALRSKAVSKALFLWKRSSAQEARRQEQASTGPELPLRPIAPAPAEPPPQVLLWFNGLRKLMDIPFNYLVPREQMLPPESIRFFCIDRAWIASLLDGAASIGRVSRDDLDRDIGRIRSDGNGRDKGLVTELAAAPSGAWSGVLLRSSVVSGWPGLLVDATAGGRTCPPVRIDRLSPNILLAIFEGQFDRVSFHLQPELLHFGFDQTEDDTPKFFKRLRRADGVEDESVKVDPIPFPDAPTAARVFSASRLAAAMREAFENKPGNPFKGSVPNSAQFALQMIEGVPRVTFWRDDTRP